MADGGNIPQAARMICPYFLRLTKERRAIVCEGAVRGSVIAMTFRTRMDMERYSEKVCETYRYNHCPIARMLGEKYAEKE